MKEIKKITTSILGRNLKLASMVGKSAGKMILGRNLTLKDNLARLLAEESHKMVNELGLMKGSVMKVGQMLSLYADVLLPDEVNNLFISLENKSYFLPWNEIRKNLPSTILEKLEIETTPLAAASLGQVHKARFEDKELVVKIQYKGVKKAIKNDIRVLKLVISMAKVVPKGINLDPLFSDVEEMLHQETDYRREAEFMEQFSNHLKDDERYIVPKVYPEFSDEQFITSEYMIGIHPREIKTDLDQETRNRLGQDFFELFFLELFDWGLIQTDPNPGNYLISPDYTKWILLDFGASQNLTPHLKEMYHEVIFCVLTGNREQFVELLLKYRYIKDGSSEVLRNYFDIIHGPFKGSVYNWGTSTITDQLIKLAPRMFREISPDMPPKDITFIDRKIGGVFFILKLLKCEFDPLPILAKYR